MTASDQVEELLDSLPTEHNWVIVLEVPGDIVVLGIFDTKENAKIYLRRANAETRLRGKKARGRKWVKPILAANPMISLPIG
jgi:hypothetical protein